MLHVVRPFTYITSSATADELIEQAVANAQKQLERCIGPELEASAIERMVLKGDPAHEILRTVTNESIDLIVMPAHGYGALERFLVGSVTAEILHNSECPVWTGAHMEDLPGQQFAIHNVLCAVDFSAHSPKTIRWAQDVMAKIQNGHKSGGIHWYRRRSKSNEPSR